ncbi:hypothetical protein [Bacteriophage sp.]|nr:hypothetical protein [Bacteriophage sp.]
MISPNSKAVTYFRGKAATPFSGEGNRLTAGLTSFFVCLTHDSLLN